MTRWECPNGIHPGQNGPQKPRRDSLVRYCLPCSQDTGRLVERVAPALERQRAARSAKTTERAATKREREYAQQWVVKTRDGLTLDLREEMNAMFKGSEELRDRARENHGSARWRPKVTVRRGGKWGTSGHAKTWTSDIVLTVGKGADSTSVRETLMHELVHAVLPEYEHHGSLFRTALCRAAKELFGTTVHPDDHSQVYGLDELIRQQMRQSPDPSA